MTTATVTTNSESIIESAKALRPLIEKQRDEMEAQGRMPRVTGPLIGTAVLV